MHVAQHGLEALHVWGVSVGQLVRQATVKAEGLQLQPDEAKAVPVKEHEQAWGALGTGEAVSCDQTRPIEAETEAFLCLITRK